MMKIEIVSYKETDFVHSKQVLVHDDSRVTIHGSGSYKINQGYVDLISTGTTFIEGKEYVVAFEKANITRFSKSHTLKRLFAFEHWFKDIDDCNNVLFQASSNSTVYIIPRDIECKRLPYSFSISDVYTALHILLDNQNPRYKNQTVSLCIERDSIKFNNVHYTSLENVMKSSNKVGGMYFIRTLADDGYRIYADAMDAYLPYDDPLDVLSGHNCDPLLRYEYTLISDDGLGFKPLVSESMPMTAYKYNTISGLVFGARYSISMKHKIQAIKTICNEYEQIGLINQRKVTDRDLDMLATIPAANSLLLFDDYETATFVMLSLSPDLLKTYDTKGLEPVIKMMETAKV